MHLLFVSTIPSVFPNTARIYALSVDPSVKFTTPALVVPPIPAPVVPSTSAPVVTCSPTPVATTNP